MMEEDELLLQAQNDTIRALLRSLELHSPAEAGHAERVAVYAAATAHELGVDAEGLRWIRRAAALHDVGKIALDADLLRKKGGLTEDEIRALRLHAALAERVIQTIPWLQDAVPIIRSHHERVDGTGYPDGLAGDDIPLGARIIAVAEAFDVMTMPSVFRMPVSEEAALAELRDCSGTQFDRAVVEAFAKIQPKVQPVPIDAS